MTTYYVDGAVGNDSNAGTSPGSGNAWLTIQQALTTVVNGDLAYVKASAVYSISTGLTASRNDYTAKKRVIGYTTTPGDGGRATIQTSAAVVGLTLSGSSWSFENFIFDGNSIGTVGIDITGGDGNAVAHCLIKNWTSYGYWNALGQASTVLDVEITACVATAALLVGTNASTAIIGCRVHGNTAIGMLLQVVDNATFVQDSLVYGNTGVGIYWGSPGWPALVSRCTVDNNAGDGIYIDNYDLVFGITNNILTRNGGYGLNMNTVSPGYSDVAIDYNWFGSGGMANTSGARNNILAGPHDLSGDPQYVNASAGNFTPQNAAVQAAFPSGWIGAVQPAGGPTSSGY